jgi:hypothetical protein
MGTRRAQEMCQEEKTTTSRGTKRKRKRMMSSRLLLTPSLSASRLLRQDLLGLSSSLGPKTKYHIKRMVRSRGLLNQPR